MGSRTLVSLSLPPFGDAESTGGGNFSTRPATDVCLRSEAPAEAARERERESCLLFGGENISL